MVISTKIAKKAVLFGRAIYVIFYYNTIIIDIFIKYVATATFITKVRRQKLL